MKCPKCKKLMVKYGNYVRADGSIMQRWHCNGSLKSPGCGSNKSSKVDHPASGNK